MILKKRPAALSAPGVEAGTGRQAMYLGIAVFLVLSFPTFLYTLSVSGLVELQGPLALVARFLGGFGVTWGLGLGIAAWSYRSSFSRKKTRDRVKRMESQLIDCLYHVRNRLSDGRPMEDALEFSGRMAPGTEMSGFLAGVLNRMKTKSLGLWRAAEEEKPGSGMIRFTFKVLGSSLREGRDAAARTASVMHDYLQRVREIDRSVVQMLQKPLSMMKATVLFFAPLVCGVIVVLFQMLTSTVSTAESQFLEGYGFSSLFTAPAISPALLQIIVGIYTVLLNLVLLRYVSRVQAGPDKTALRWELARSIPITLLIFTATIVAGRIILGA
jgi:hypothetical protein